jgi:hypothetical protein
MTITVYWACLEDQWMLAQQPQSVASKFYQNYSFNNDEPASLINYCPSFNGNLKNLYTLQSIYDYDFKIINDQISTDKYDGQFFNEHVTIRSFKNRFFSFNNRYIFFTDEPSLNVTFYEYPFLEDNNITTRCIIPAGQFDIGCWFRNTEFSFFLKKEFDEFKISNREIYSYMRIHSNKNIKFVQFRYTQKISEYNKDGFQLTRTPLKKLENYYKNFKNKKLILKEIRENII